MSILAVVTLYVNTVQGQPPIVDFSIIGTEDWAKIKKAPLFVVQCLSGSLNRSGDGTAPDILTGQTDNIHLSISLPRNKRFFGKVMLIIRPRQRNTEPK